MFKEAQELYRTSSFSDSTRKSFGTSQGLLYLVQHCATRQMMFVLLTAKSKYCSYQFSWLGTLFLDLLGFCLLWLKHLLSGKWRTCFIWEDVEKNWASAYIYGLGCQLYMKIPM